MAMSCHNVSITWCGCSTSTVSTCVQCLFAQCSIRQWHSVWSPAAADFKAVDNIRLTLLLITRNAHSWSQIAEKVFWCKWNLRCGESPPVIFILGGKTLLSWAGTRRWVRWMELHREGERSLSLAPASSSLLAGLSNTSSASLALAL